MLGTIWQQHWLRMQQITLLDPQVFLQYNGHMDMIQELERRNDPLEANGERNISKNLNMQQRAGELFREEGVREVTRLWNSAPRQLKTRRASTIDAIATLSKQSRSFCACGCRSTWSWLKFWRESSDTCYKQYFTNGFGKHNRFWTTVNFWNKKRHSN